MENIEKLVSTNQYIESKRKWDVALSSGENVAVLFPPVSDSRRRMTQFMEDNKEKYCFVSVDLEDVAIEEVSDLEKYLISQVNCDAKPIIKKQDFTSSLEMLSKMGKKMIITSNLADPLFGLKGKHFLSLFQKIYFDHQPDIAFLLFFETDITNTESLALTKSYHIIFENILYYPLYGEGDTMTFINYLCNKWNLKITKKTKNEIIEKCGGYFWLVKEAVREIRDDGKWSIESEQFKYRLETIAQSFSESEYLTVTKIIGKSRSLDEKQTHSKDYLKKIGIVKNDGTLAVSLLKEEFIKLGAAKRELVLSGQEVFLNDVPVTKYFSRKELRVLKLLLSRKKEIVNRDDVAGAIWPIDTDENYSEWAIDQIIRRLRNRLGELLIPKTILKSVRGKGYIYG